MAQPSVSVPWGAETIPLALPDAWHIQGFLEPASISPVPDVDGEIQRSLSHPIGSGSIKTLAKPGMKVVLVVDDASRPTPVKKILPYGGITYPDLPGRAEEPSFTPGEVPSPELPA